MARRPAPIGRPRPHLLRPPRDRIHPPQHKRSLLERRGPLRRRVEAKGGRLRAPHMVPGAAASSTFLVSGIAYPVCPRTQANRFSVSLGFSKEFLRNTLPSSHSCRRAEIPFGFLTTNLFCLAAILSFPSRWISPARLLLRRRSDVALTFPSSPLQPPDRLCA